MNYYEHHLGDYAAATAHLSWDEDMAYTRLIRAYYHHEKPLPPDVKDVCRLVRAASLVQKKAVDTVLREFFTLDESGWHQKRCDEEIARYEDKRSKAKGSANARWNAKRSDSGGNANASETHTERICENNANAMRTQCDGNALQSPVSNHQTPDTRTREERTARATRLPSDWSLTPERRAIAETEHVDPDRTFAKFSSYWRSASGAKARKVDWDATWRNWCMNETDRKPNGSGGPHVTKFERTRVAAPEVDEHGNEIPF